MVESLSRDCRQILDEAIGGPSTSESHCGCPRVCAGISGKSLQKRCSPSQSLKMPSAWRTLERPQSLWSRGKSCVEGKSRVNLVSEHGYSVGRFLLMWTSEKEAIAMKTAQAPLNLWRTGPVLKGKKDPWSRWSVRKVAPAISESAVKEACRVPTPRTEPRRGRLSVFPEAVLADRDVSWWLWGSFPVNKT